MYENPGRVTAPLPPAGDGHDNDINYFLVPFFSTTYEHSFILRESDGGAMQICACCYAMGKSILTSISNSKFSGLRFASSKLC